MTDVDRILEGLLAREGGYVDDPRDAGGETMFGITRETARANGWTGAMRALPRALALDIYRRRYVAAPRFDAVLALAPAVGAELIDTGVNMGPRVAAGFLQRLLNALNAGATLYADLAADGEIGAATLAALRAFLGRRGKEGEVVLVTGLNALQAERYIALAEARPANEAFVYGWLRTRAGAPSPPVGNRG